MIEARGLTRRFGDVEAVNGIDLDVAAGEVYAFLGPNGAGKSTTTAMLVTLLRPTSGTAKVAGHDVVSESDAVRRSIGVTLQDISLDPMMTATELMALHLALHRLSRQKAAGTELIAQLGLADAADRPVKTYSGGMRRRLDLALALVHRPKVLFLDEPTTGLDPASRLVIWEKVRELHAQGTTVFLTTQYLEEADQLADRVAILDKGRIVSEGTPAELKATAGQPRLDLRLEHGAGLDVAALLSEYGSVINSGDNAWSITVNDESTDLSGVMSTLAGSGVVVQSLDLVRPTLEDVFIAKTGRRLEGSKK